MRTVKRYEPSDIDPRNNVHLAVMTGITLAMAEARLTTGLDSTEEIIERMKSVVANFLNLMIDMEIDITDRTRVPEVFRQAMDES